MIAFFIPSLRSVASAIDFALLSLFALFAVARNFINSLERIPQTIEQYKEKNTSLAKDIPLLKEIANKQWKKEDELKGLKSELAALDRKIQLELAKDNEPQQQQAVANGDDVVEVSSQKETPSKGLKP